jgi:glycosyl hydrolase family 26
MHRTRRLRRAAAAAAAIVTMAVAASLLPLAGGPVGGAAAVAATAAQPLQLGVYTHPGAKGVAGARAFADWSGAPVSRVLDFLPSTSWLEMTRNAWLLTPYTGTGYQLELSVPMLPDSAGVSLAGCAAGDYDGYWTSIATSVVAAGLPTTAIRPGWEMNGAWYRWTAVGRAAEYAGCWRRLVTAMRSVPGQRFTFTFNPNVGDNPMSAETAYPGDAYVDDVSVDVYDTSWNSYPTPSGMSTDDARASAWNYLLKGSHGLRFWAGFAASHGKPLAVGEWGITWRSDGHGGGDDADFVDRFFDWASDPANNVRYLNYFNCADSATLRHDLMRADTTFPRSAARFRARSAAVAAAQRAAAGGSGGSVPATAPTTAPTVTPTPTAPTVTPTPTTPAATPTATQQATPAAPTTSPATQQATPTTRPTTRPTTSARRGALAVVRRPVLTGRSRHRATLSVSAGHWRPAPSARRYVWLRDGRAIPRATRSTYRVTRADVGHRLRVRVEVSRPGYRPGRFVTHATRAVRR